MGVLIVSATIIMVLASSIVMGRRGSTKWEKIAFASGLAGFSSMFAAIPLLLKDMASIAGNQQGFQISLPLVVFAIALAAFCTALTSSCVLLAKRVRT